MSVTFTARMDSLEDKKKVNDALAKISDRYPECNMKRYALLKLVDLYLSDFDATVYKDIPVSVQATINEIGCSYLKYEGEELGFLCYEKFHVKKKGEAIGGSHDKVITRCNLCRLGKHDKEQYKIQEQLRKKNIKSILELRDILINLTHSSTLAQIYICKGLLLEEHQLIISADGIHLQCPLELDEKGKMLEMAVIEHCYEQINPHDMNPPCKHLIDPHVRVRPPERAEEIIEELSQLEYQPPVEEKPDTKDVDAEVIEPEEDEEKKDE